MNPTEQDLTRLFERVAALEAVNREREKRLQERWQQQEQNVREARRQIDERLVLLNELRVGVVTKDMYLGQHAELVKRVDALEASSERHAGAARLGENLAVRVGAILGLILSLGLIVEQFFIHVG